MSKTTSYLLILLLILLIGCTPNISDMQIDFDQAGSLHKLQVACNGTTITNKEIIEIPEAIQIGSTASVTIKLANIKEGYVELTENPLVQLRNNDTGDFMLETSGLQRTLNQDESSDFTLICSPKTSGSKYATIVIKHNSLDDPEFIFTVKIKVISSEIAVTTDDIPVLLNSTYSLQGTTSETKVFTISNTGDVPITLDNFEPILISGPDSASFSCIQPVKRVIGKDETSNFTITFNPKSSGVKRATVTINSPSPDMPHFTFEVMTGHALPIMKISEETGQPVSQGQLTKLTDNTKRFIITNTGNAPLTLDSLINTNYNDFTLTTPDLFTLQPDETADFTITFNPVESGIKTTNILIISNDPATPYFQLMAQSYDARGALVVTDDGGAALDLAAPLVFQTTDFAQTSTRTILLTNKGNYPLTVEKTTLSGGTDFTLTRGYSGWILPGESKELAISFKAVSAGKKEDKLTIMSDAQNLTITLVASDFAPRFSITDPSGNALLNGQRLTLTSNTKRFVIENTGNAPLTLDSVVNTNIDDFILTGPATMTLNQDETADFTLRFSPQTAGVKTTTILIITNDAGLAYFQVPVQSYDVAPELVVTDDGGAALDLTAPIVFQSTDFAQTSTRTILLTNKGNYPLMVEKTALSGGTDFTLTRGYSGPILPGESKELAISFKAVSAGKKEDSLTIMSDAQNLTIALVASDFAPRFSITEPAGNALLNGQRLTLTTDTKRFVIENTGNAPLTLDSVVNTNIDDFILTGPATMTLNQDETADFTIRFSPQTAGIKTTTILIITNDAGLAYFQVPVQSYNAAPELVVTDMAGSKLTEETPIDFTGATYQTESERSFKIANWGRYPVIIDSISLSETGDFTLKQGLAGVLDAGEVRVITVGFKPLTPGPKATSLTIRSDVATIIRPVQAPTFIPEFTITDDADQSLGNMSTLEFDTGTNSESYLRTLTLTNTGNFALHVESLTVADSDAALFTYGHAGSPANGFTLVPGQDRYVTVTFEPGNAYGPRNAKLSFNTNHPEKSRIELNLTTAGIGPKLSVLQGASHEVTNGDIVTLPIPDSTSDLHHELPLIMKNTNAFYDLTIDSIEITGKDAGDFTLSGFSLPAKLTMGNNTRAGKIVYTPTSRYAKTVELVIRSNTKDADKRVFTFTLKTPELAGMLEIKEAGSGTVIKNNGIDHFGITEYSPTGYSKSYTLTNTGNYPVRIVNPALSGAMGEVTLDVTDDFTIDQGAHKTVSLTYQPVTPAVKDMQVHLDYRMDNEITRANGINVITDELKEELTVTVDDSGNPVIEPNTTYSGFGNHFYRNHNQSVVTKTFTIKNTGIFPIDLSLVTIGGANADNFILDTASFNAGRLSPNSTTQCKVTFRPRNIGLQVADVTIQSSADDVVFTISGKLYGQVTKTIEYKKSGTFQLLLNNDFPLQDHMHYENITADFVLIGGGSDGGYWHTTPGGGGGDGTKTKIGGGGGAGEIVSDKVGISLSANTTYTLTVGGSSQATTVSGAGITQLVANTGSYHGTGYPPADGDKGGNNGSGYGKGGDFEQSGQGGYIKITFTADVVE